MALDIRTLIVASLIVSAVHGGLSLFFAFQNPGTRAIRYCGIGTLLLAIGLAGVAARGSLHWFASISLANGLIVAALVYTDRGIRLFTREETRDRWGPAAVVVSTVGLTALYLVTPDSRPRSVFVSVIMALLLGRIALRLHRHVPAEARRAYRFTEGLFWAWTLLMALRGILTAAGPARPSFMAPDPIQAALFVVTMVLVSSSTLGFMWMEIYWLNEELVRLATRDSLTGTLNRSAFLAACEREVERGARLGGPFSLVLLDLDHFKQVNDVYGHPAGDSALRQVVGVLHRVLRGKDVLSRLGGEEFAVLLPDTDAETALAIATRARGELEGSLIEVSGKPLAMTVSGGISSFPVHGTSVDDLIHAADAALYDAKRAGRNRVELAGKERAGGPRPLQEA